MSEKNHYLSPYNFADGNPVFFNDPSGLDSGMPSWMQDLWDASPGNATTTWTNDGNGSFVVTNIEYAAINAGPSSGGSSSSGSSIGGGGIAGFGIGSTYNYNTGVLNTSNGSFVNIGKSPTSDTLGFGWQPITLQEVIVWGKNGKWDSRTALVEMIAQINGVLGNSSSGWNLDRINDIANGLDIGTGIIDELWMTATYLNYRSARNPWAFHNLRETQQNWRINNTLGRFGSKMLNVLKGVGVVAGIVQIGISGYKIADKGVENATIKDWVDLGVNALGVGAAVFLGATPLGWAIGAGALIYSIASPSIYEYFDIK